MEYRELGRTGIKVSSLCLGTMTWGEQNTEAEGHAQMDYALTQGINFFDTSEMYAVPPKPETQGATERIIGSWFKARGTRSKVVLAKARRMASRICSDAVSDPPGEFRRNTMAFTEPASPDSPADSTKAINLNLSAS